MGKKVWKKLVRDRIPEFLRQKGVKVQATKITDPKEKKWLLWEKLKEELKELVEADSEHVLEEIGDVMSVARGLAHAYGFTDREIETQIERKDKERGAFEEGVFLIETEEK